MFSRNHTTWRKPGSTFETWEEAKAQCLKDRGSDTIEHDDHLENGADSTKPTYTLLPDKSGFVATINFESLELRQGARFKGRRPQLQAAYAAGWIRCVEEYLPSKVGDGPHIVKE